MAGHEACLDTCERSQLTCSGQGIVLQFIATYLSWSALALVKGKAEACVFVLKHLVGV